MIFFLCILLCSCESETIDTFSLSSAETSSASVSETKQPYLFTGTESFSNLTMENGGHKMGDDDGPAYCVYSKLGYNGASIEIELSELELNIYREDLQHVNAYLFLGVDIYDPTDGYWVNCADAGLVYSGNDGWHIFYNLYTCANPQSTNTWYESGKRLRSDHDYRLTMDSSSSDGMATLTVYDLTSDTIADYVTFELQYARKDGSNTAYLTDFALDYPDELKKDTSGNPSENNWIEITLYNTDCGMYMRNIRVKDCTLYQNGEAIDWTVEVTENRGIWPDASIQGIDYPCTIIRSATENMEYIVDLDLNRN